MASDPRKLDRIRVQTARMVEIYSLVRRELESGSGRVLPATQRDQLDRAIDTIAANMQQLQTYLTSESAESSPVETKDLADTTGCGDSSAVGHHQSTELDELVEAVLKWHMERESSSSSGPPLGQR